MNHSAVCCCGKVSLVIQGQPIVKAICHCNDCKKRTGSAFGISIYVKNSQVTETQGSTSVYEVDTDVQQQRFFCTNCGTTIYWKVSNFPDLTGIAGGCFTDMDFIEPEYTISNENICSWVSLPSKLKTEITQASFQ